MRPTKIKYAKRPLWMIKFDNPVDGTGVGVGVVVKVGVPKTRAVEKILLVVFAWVEAVAESS